MLTYFASALIAAYASAHSVHKDGDGHSVKPYSRDYYAAHACEHAVWDLEDRIQAIYINDQEQNVDLGDANGTIEPYSNQIVPLDQKACSNDARTADNKQTDIDQSATIAYLEGRKSSLEHAIGDLTGSVMSMHTTVMDYSKIDPANSTAKTNVNFKSREEALAVRKGDQGNRIDRIYDMYYTI